LYWCSAEDPAPFEFLKKNPGVITEGLADFRDSVQQPLGTTYVIENLDINAVVEGEAKNAVRRDITLSQLILLESRRPRKI